jgi:hypothetical protein
MAVAQMTRDRYGNISNMARYVSLLAEFGADIAKQAAGQADQFRITAQRPEGKTGNTGSVALGVVGKAAPSVTVQQR